MARAPLVVELYTSEGCDSCPPADQWLSSLKGRTDVVAAAFHVDYWDRLGWKDRFAEVSHTQRQAAAQRVAGSKFSYTPQVLVNGRDWRQWPALPQALAAAPVQILLQRESDDRVLVRVQAGKDAPRSLSLWWALVEDGHLSRVMAGENTGRTLRHDHVVRSHGQRTPWLSSDGASWPILARAQGPDGHRQRLLVVVTDPQTGSALQAVSLDC